MRHPHDFTPQLYDVWTFPKYTQWRKIAKCQNFSTDIRTRQRGTRNNLIYRLSFLGWTQEEIADVVGLKQNTISMIIKNANFSKIDNDYQNGKSAEEIANYYGYDLPLVWAILLQGKTDLEIFY